MAGTASGWRARDCFNGFVELTGLIEFVELMGDQRSAISGQQWLVIGD